MFSKHTIIVRLFACVAAMTVLVLVLGFTGLSSIGSLADLFGRTLDTTVQKMSLAEQIEAAGLEMIAAQRGVVLGAYKKAPAEIEQEKDRFRASADKMRKALDDFRPLASTPEGRQAISEDSSRYDEWMPRFAEVARLAAAGDAEQANQIRTQATAPLYNDILRNCKLLLSVQKDLLAKDRLDAVSELSRARWMAFGMLFLCVAALAYIALSVKGIGMRLSGVVSGLSGGASRMADAATQVSTASQSLARDSSQQAASLEETSASSQEIDSMARRSSDSSRRAAELVSLSQRKFTETNQSLDSMVVAIGDIGVASERISKIIKVIDEIAFQTNILALNAAVEAARAGEAGKGFAVVADEVRNLAQRSAQAAKDTASLIEASISKSKGGKQKVDEVASAIAGITTEFMQIGTLVQEISEGAEGQARGTEQIGRAIVQMERVTQKTAANAEESASVSEELTAQSKNLKEIVRQLALMVGGDERAPARNPLPAAAALARRAVQPLKRVLAPVAASLAPPALPAPSSSPAVAVIDKNDFPLDGDFAEF